MYNFKVTYKYLGGIKVSINIWANGIERAFELADEYLTVAGLIQVDKAESVSITKGDSSGSKT